MRGDIVQDVFITGGGIGGRKMPPTEMRRKATEADFGRHFGGGLFEAEVRYLVDEE